MKTIHRWFILFAMTMCCAIGLTACASQQVVPTLSDEQVKQLLDAQRSPKVMHNFATALDEFNRKDVDVNKDGVPEILIDGKLDFFLPYLAVIGYSGNTWNVWFYRDDIGRYCADHKSTTVENGFVVDLLTCDGGTGVFNAVWTRYEVNCISETCELMQQDVVWHDGTSGVDSALPLTETIKLPSDLEWTTSGGAMRFRPQPTN